MLFKCGFLCCCCVVFVLLLLLCCCYVDQQAALKQYNYISTTLRSTRVFFCARFVCWLTFWDSIASRSKTIQIASRLGCCCEYSLFHRGISTNATIACRNIVKVVWMLTMNIACLSLNLLCITSSCTMICSLSLYHNYINGLDWQCMYVFVCMYSYVFVCICMYKACIN